MQYRLKPTYGRCYVCHVKDDTVNQIAKYAFICRNCNTEKCRKFRATEAGKQASRMAVIRYEKANPKRRKAWKIAASRIENKPCEVCGELRSHRHHPNIDKPLEINFLCPLHHKLAHKVLQ